MKKILILGSGAREHVIGETLKRSSHGVELFVLAPSKNPGLTELATEYEVASVTDFDRLRELVQRVRPSFVVPGPEAPIAAGAADLLLEMGVPCFAPLATAARLESSKSFTRDLVSKYKIPGNPLYRVFHSKEGLADFMEGVLGGQFVVKADGLQGGKGVKVVGDHLRGVAEGVTYAEECLAESGRVVIEEKFVGQEFSLMSFVDGETVVDMMPIQDHKRAFVGDTGPNTGGMGTYSDANLSLPFLTEKDLADAHDITVRVARAIFEETGVRYRGVMYGGFIAVKDGVRLIEYNARFGDPEALNALSLLSSDLVEICEATVRGELAGVQVTFERKASVCKYVVPNGYPDAGIKNERIEIGPLPQDVHVYYGSVDRRDDGLYLGGSRAVACVGIADTLEQAERSAQQACESVTGPVFFRSDVGTRGLIDQRVAMMRTLRG